MRTIINLLAALTIFSTFTPAFATEQFVCTENATFFSQARKTTIVQYDSNRYAIRIDDKGFAAFKWNNNKAIVIATCGNGCKIKSIGYIKYEADGTPYLLFAIPSAFSFEEVQSTSKKIVNWNIVSV